MLYTILWVTPVLIAAMVVFYLKVSPDLVTPVELVWIAAGAALVFFLPHFLPETILTSRTFAIGCFVVLNILMLLSLLSFDTQPVSDYRMIWDTATVMASGSYDIANYPELSYQNIFNWQTGMAAFEGLIIRIFGPNFLVLQILAALLINATGYALFRIVRGYYGHRAGACALMLWCIFYPTLVAVNQLNNQQIASLLILLTLFLTSGERPALWRMAIAGLLTGLINVVRPMGMIVILTILCMTVYNLIMRRQTWKGAICRTGALLACYAAVVIVFNVLFVNLHYANGPVSQANIPYYKFDFGLNGKAEQVKNHTSLEDYNATSKARVMAALKSPATPVNMAKNMCLYLGLVDMQMEHTYNHDRAVFSRYPFKGLLNFGWGEYFAAAVLAAMGFSILRRRKGFGPDIYQIFFIGNTLVYLFIEAYPSYRCVCYPYLFMWASVAMAQRTTECSKCTASSEL